MLVWVGCARVCDVPKAQADFFIAGAYRACGAALILGIGHFCESLLVGDAGVIKELASSSSDAPASWFVWRHARVSVLWPVFFFQVIIPAALSDADVGAIWAAVLEGDESPSKRWRPRLGSSVS